MVHCDIKPQNILLHKDSGGDITAKIADLGLCMHVKSGSYQRIGENTRGTPMFAAPESLNSLKNAKVSFQYEMSLSI